MLPPLLEQIYDTGRVVTDEGDERPAEPVGVPRAHALRLHELVCEHDLQRTLETGMAYGLSTLGIAAAHAERGAGRHIAIDPEVDGYYEGIGRANLQRAGVAPYVCVVAEKSQLALPRLTAEGVRIDFAFIDGMHLFDYALIDFFYVDQMLASGGYVAFHDTWMPSIQDAVDFVLTNRDYERHDKADGGLAVLRKRAPDRRAWTHYRPFARPRLPPRSAKDEARALFRGLSDGALEAAERAGGARKHQLVVAGGGVRMSFTSEALEAALMPAFAHARRDAAAHAAGDDVLEIQLWEGVSSGLDDPAIPWAIGDVRARGDVRGYEDATVAVFCEPASGAITAFDRERAEIAYWVAHAESVPWYERGAPLRAALHRWAADRGRHFVHAGAVATAGAGVLLAGASGSGKSTTALACLAAGFDYAGDDYVVLTTGVRVHAHCVYSTAKLDAGALERVPGLRPAVVQVLRGRETKAVLDLHGFGQGLVKSALPVHAIVLPAITPGRERPAVRPASAADALRALAPTTILQLPGAAHERMHVMAALVRRVPVFRLELGSDMSAVPEAVAAICADVRETGDIDS